VFIFLNNDTVILSSDWMQRMSEKALREDVGTVGGLLLFEDNTIQHAGVVMGMGGWADHIFKGMKPVHFGSPFVSPMLTRNVAASTGACLAVSRKTINKIGDFNEDFIICGSDVEISLRAIKQGLNNIYDPHVKLYHLESKTRSSFIPEIDFIMSKKHYSPYREEGDPFFNANLSLSSVVPIQK
jgi:GT2 family glycosyltransferase